jgi:hypothetical protein
MGNHLAGPLADDGGHRRLGADGSPTRTTDQIRHAQPSHDEPGVLTNWVLVSSLETLQVLQRTSAGHLRFNRNPFEAWALLRENRGNFIKQPPSGDVQIVATGRGAWIGWVELTTVLVDEIAVRMTAKVINEVNADILGVVETEDRPALARMNQELLDAATATRC